MHSANVSFSAGPSAHLGAFACKLLVCGCLLTFGLTQRSPAQPVKWGGRLGPAFGFFNDSPIPFISDPDVTEAGTNVRIDVNAGLHAVVPLTDRYAVQPELLFVQKGTHFARFGDGFYASERYRISYVQTHLLGRRDISVPGPLSLHVVGGLTGAVATGGVVRRDVRTRIVDASERIALLKTNLVRRWDIGGLVGLGIGYPVGRSGTLALSLRYNPGFRTLFTENERPAGEQTEIGDEPSPLTRTPPPLRHDVILVSLSYTATLW